MQGRVCIVRAPNQALLDNCRRKRVVDAVKWHPAHKLAGHERSIAWFDFWLRGVRSDDPARAPERARWEAMKRRLDRLPAG